VNEAADQLELGNAPGAAKPFHCGASVVIDAIVAAHAAPEWCVFTEVADATSGRCSRRADALAMNMWQSRGLEFRGFEVKVDRSDLKRELEDPSKAEAIGRFCDTWCLAYPSGLVRPDDNIPPTWGLFEVNEKGGRFRRLPTTRPRDEVVQPTRVFTAAIARAAHAELEVVHKGELWIRRSDIQGRIDEAFRRGVENAPKEHGYRLRDLEAKEKQLQEIVAALGFDENGFKNEWSEKVDLDRTVVALKLGVALASAWGDSVPEKALHDIKTAMEHLAKATKALRPLVVNGKDAGK
jgi:hypothetical protein